MHALPKDPLAQSRLLTSSHAHEDAAVVRVPAGKALVQTVDFFTPIVNDPFAFGRIAAANALSDIYAMGGEPWTAMNIVGFPLKTMPAEILQRILAGGAEALLEAGAVLAGGHSVEDTEIKYGMAVTGLVNPEGFAANTGLRAGDTLVLTKPLGTGVLATAVKARWEGHEAMEELIIQWAGRLNKHGAEVIQALGLKAATDVTGFGLGGHLLEMVEASGVSITLYAEAVPLLPRVHELASIGLLPAGSHANRAHCQPRTQVGKGVDPIVVDLVFDTQTSGGLVLAVPAQLVHKAVSLLHAKGEPAYIIGEVVAADGVPNLHILP